MNLSLKNLLFVAVTVCSVGCNHRSGNESPDILWPEPPPGATLYAGEANIPDIRSFRMAFILSADQKEMSGLTIVVGGLKYSFMDENTQIESSGISSETFTEKTYPVQSPSTDIMFGNSALTGLTFTDDGAEATVKFIYEAIFPVVSSTLGVAYHGIRLVPFPAAHIRFKAWKD